MGKPAGRQDQPLKLIVKKATKWAGCGIVVLFGLLQFTNPARTNPPVQPGRELGATNAPPAQITTLLRAACYDCHSHETVWPWYSRIAPVSWYIVDHIKDGRRRLNFSEWPHDDPRKARSRMQNIRDEIESGSMPLKSYTLIHRSSALTSEQREQLLKWADEEAKRLSATLESGEAK